MPFKIIFISLSILSATLNDFSVGRPIPITCLRKTTTIDGHAQTAKLSESIYGNKCLSFVNCTVKNEKWRFESEDPHKEITQYYTSNPFQFLQVTSNSLVSTNRSLIVYSPASIQVGFWVPLMVILCACVFCTLVHACQRKTETSASDQWKFPPEKLSFKKRIGEGKFGQVHKARANGIVYPGISTTVAVKNLKADHGNLDRKNLTEELETMKIAGNHRNVVNLLGCCTESGVLLVITEFASRGNLKSFLNGSVRTPRTLTSPVAKRPQLKHLIRYAIQVAEGMQFLSEKNCVHRNLAARHILMDENFVIKIANFDHEKTKFIESLCKRIAPKVFAQNKHLSKTDIWTFGVVLWEIMERGKAPYPKEMAYLEVYETLIKDFMPTPSNCPQKICQLTNQCWQYDCMDLPNFEQIIKSLQGMVNGDGVNTNSG